MSLIGRRRKEEEKEKKKRGQATYWHGIGAGKSNSMPRARRESAANVCFHVINHGNDQLQGLFILTKTSVL